VFGNGKIFISHTHQDNALCDLLTSALDVWQLDYWIDVQQLSAGQELLAHIHKPLSERDIFIRVCTPAANRSPWMDQEELLAESLRAPNRGGKRLFINLVMAIGYQLSEIEKSRVVIEATSGPSGAWIRQLRQALGVPAIGGRLNRRAFIGLGVTSVAAVGALGFAGKELLAPSSVPGYRPSVYEPKSTPQAAASRVLWNYSIESTYLDSNGVGLSVDASGLYAATTFALFSLSPADGALRWERFDAIPEAAPSFTDIPGQTAPAVVGDTLYLLAQNGDPLLLLAMSTQDGSQRWQITLDANQEGNTIYFTAPVVPAGGSVLVQYNDTIAAFDTATQVSVWSSQPARNVDVSGALDNSPDSVMTATPVVSGDIIYAGLPDGNLYAYSLATGNLLWVFSDFASGPPIQSTPAVVNGVVYFGRDDGFCYAVDAQAGTLVWKRRLAADTFGVSAPTVVNGVVYLCSGTASVFAPPPARQADDVYALEARTGSVLWHTHPSQAVLGGQLPAYPIMNQPLWHDGTLYVTASIAPAQWAKRDILYALDSSDGSVKWQYIVAGQGTGDTNNEVPSPPVAYGDVVYFVSSDATVYAMSLA
jgi:outer membrane protein assembly factor BamB